MGASQMTMESLLANLSKWGFTPEHRPNAIWASFKQFNGAKIWVWLPKSQVSSEMVEFKVEKGLCVFQFTEKPCTVESFLRETLNDLN